MAAGGAVAPGRPARWPGRAVSTPARIRRRGRRHRLRLRVTTGRGSSFTVNVSGGGYCTELMRVQGVGEPVEGVIHTARGRTSFRGQVAWAAAGDSRLGIRGRMGVRFLQVDRPFAALLEAIADSPAPGTLDGSPGGAAPLAPGRRPAAAVW